MTALWLDPTPQPRFPQPAPSLRGLRLVEGDPVRSDEYDPIDPVTPGFDGLVVVPEQWRHSRTRRRTSTEVRRRRTLLAIVALLLVGLALPLSGTGGRSHATGSAPVETGSSGVYTAKAGDTLWSIAQRMDPTADPRPLVAQMARETGSDTVVPGEQIRLP